MLLGFDTLVDLIFPCRCISCDQLGAAVLCPPCLATLQRVDKLYHRMGLDGIASTYEHGGAIATVIGRMKYGGESWLAPILAGLVVAPLPALPFGRSASIVPIPLHRRRLAERGFNQAALIGRHVARHYRLGFLPRALTRVLPTAPQVGQQRAARLQSLAGAFIGNTRALSDKRIILLDDVMTTGATLAACAAAARAAGATEVYGMTVSYRA